MGQCGTTNRIHVKAQNPSPADQTTQYQDLERQYLHKNCKTEEKQEWEP